MKEEPDAYSGLEKPVITSQENENVSPLVEEKPVLPSVSEETKPELAASVELEVNPPIKSEKEGNCYWFVHYLALLDKNGHLEIINQSLNNPKSSLNSVIECIC